MFFAALGARHQRITPYTPRHNGKVERYDRILAEEFLYAREWVSEQQRTDALSVWNAHYNYQRPHAAAAPGPVLTFYSPEPAAPVLSSGSTGRNRGSTEMSRQQPGRDGLAAAGLVT